MLYLAKKNYKNWDYKNWVIRATQLEHMGS